VLPGCCKSGLLPPLKRAEAKLKEQEAKNSATEEQLKLEHMRVENAMKETERQSMETQRQSAEIDVKMKAFNLLMQQHRETTGYLEKEIVVLGRIGNSKRVASLVDDLRHQHDALLQFFSQTQRFEYQGTIQQVSAEAERSGVGFAQRVAGSSNNK